MGGHLMMPDPLVSVVMPVYNVQAFLPAAMQSLLAQTFTDFEVICVDDGSTDDGVALLNEFALRDSRIRLACRPHQGLSSALNYGLDLARGRYIARMDGDDICHPARFERQIAFLAANPRVTICGTWLRPFRGIFPSETGPVWRYPTEHHEIQATLLFKNCVGHPSVMMHRRLLEDATCRYDSSYYPLEDYHLWAVASRRFLLANIPEVLLDYRLHAAQTTVTGSSPLRENQEREWRMQLKHLGILPTEEELRLHEDFGRGALGSGQDCLLLIEAWLRKLQEANHSSRVYDIAFFDRFLANHWLASCRAVEPCGTHVWTRFFHSPLSRHLSTSWLERLKLRVKSTLPPFWRAMYCR